MGGKISGVDKLEKIYNFGDDMMIQKLKIRLGYDSEKLEEVDKDVKDDKENIEEKKIACVFCGGQKGIFLYMGKYICSECYNDLREKYLE